MEEEMHLPPSKPPRPRPKPVPVPPPPPPPPAPAPPPASVTVWEWRNPSCTSQNKPYGDKSTCPSEPSLTSSIDMAWIKSINSACPMDNQFTIFKVPNHIRQLDPGAYNPLVASFGLFHASFGNLSHHPIPSYERSVMQEYKRQCVRHLLSRHGSQESANQLLENCLLQLIEQDGKVRSCYSEEPPKWVGAQDTAKIMLLDGCCIIYLMLKRRESIDRREGREASNIEGKEPTVAGLFTIDLVLHDLLKLENQIPFFVIQLLFDNLRAPQDREIDLVDLALKLFEGIRPEEYKPFNRNPPDEYHHLLHLFYSSRTPSENPAESTYAPPPKWIPNAMELDRAGVKFKKKKPPADNFLNITFERRKMKITPLLCLLKLCLIFRSGRMEIPPLQIYDYTGPLFQNLIAFEQCYHNTQMHITIYALFMDCIIDQAEDVRLLHLEGILEHKLSSDQAVAELFNKLGCQVYFDSKKNYLANQIEKVNKFYDSKWHKWLAALRRDYLSNPWAIISVLAAIFLLLLTVEQAVFSALSYFHPR